MNTNTMIGATPRSAPPAGRRRQVIAERVYSGYQPSDFVRICRYVIREGISFRSADMVVAEEGMNSLLIELENRLKASVSAVRVQVTQLDAEGHTIGEVQHTFQELRAASGATFVPREAILLRPACTAVTIRVLYADAGAYRYRICGDIPEVGLTEEADERTREEPSSTCDWEEGVKGKDTRDYRLAALAVAAVVMILLAINLYSVLYTLIGRAVDDFLLNDLWGPVQRFFTEVIPNGFREVFIEGIPNAIKKFFTELVPILFRRIFS